MPTVSEIRPVKKSAEAELLKRPGVTGVDIGYKFVDGKKTSTLAIRVYVEKKRDVPAREAIPETISEVKTDVIERRFELKPRMMRVLDLVPEVDTGEYDPLRGGMSIGPCRQVFLDAAEAACHDAPGPAYRAAQSSRAGASRQTARAERVRFASRGPCGAVGPGARRNRQAVFGGRGFPPPVAHETGTSAAEGATSQREERTPFSARLQDHNVSDETSSS